MKTLLLTALVFAGTIAFANEPAKTMTSAKTAAVDCSQKDQAGNKACQERQARKAGKQSFHSKKQGSEAPPKS